ncbi:hypothetical protein [Bacillus phage CP-51]|uniref:Uncharacterized protein n=1 Tax=Bacillus phage CP-51 TaxID=1391188 RepID=A0A068EU93_9CAUD|nr:hypothetical protein OZ73_gp166 [Bacillus phage CP-51]AID50601.1 hypothetical protein [Bacillus phage CP-51]
MEQVISHIEYQVVANIVGRIEAEGQEIEYTKEDINRIAHNIYADLCGCIANDYVRDFYSLED